MRGARKDPLECALYPTRRDVLRLGGAAASVFLCHPSLVPNRNACRSARSSGACASSWPPTSPARSKALGALGFEAVELENAFGKSGAEWRTQLDAARLKACGFHHRLDELQGDKLAASVEFNQAIGNRNLIIRSLPPEVYNRATS